MKIFILAKPRAKNNIVQKLDENSFEVFVTAPPIKGLANKAIGELLAEYFDVSKSEVKLISGYTCKNKIFNITILNKPS